MAFINSRMPRAAKLFIAIALVFIIFVYSLFHLDTSNLTKYASTYNDLGARIRNKDNVAAFQSSMTSSVPLPNTQTAHNFWREFASALNESNPESIIKTLFMEDSERVGWVGFDGVREGEKQPDYLKMTATDIEGLSKLHKTMVEHINRIAGQLPYVPGTRGIVTTAGKTADAILTTSLRMLRKSGSKLPVQIWLYDESEYDQKLCEHIWKSMDATCMMMTDYLPQDVWSKGATPLEISHHFQMKMLSIMFSTFEHALFLDCDLFPVNKPDSIFLTEPFLSSGYVLWPDYWANTNSKHYSTIAGKPQADMYERQSTESGAMIVNKATHAKAMLLSAYYNRYGVEHYYWLFSQGAIGHGDKETYLPAIQYFDLPFYQVDSTPRRVGYRCNGGERAIASAQSHPYDDYLITSKNLSRSHNNLLADIPVPRILFVHGNLPKNDPVSLMAWYIPESWTDQLRCDQGTGAAHRQWGPRQGTMFQFGWDAEKALWDQMRWMACAAADSFKRWQDGLSIECTPTAVAGGWCPADKLGTVHLFQEGEKNICERFVALYAEVLPGETYDSSLPDKAEMPWSSLAGAVAI